MNSQNKKLTAQFDLSQTISSETSLMPLLAKVLERLMFHTKYSCGIVLNSTQLTDNGIDYQIKAAIGEQNIEHHVDAHILDSSNPIYDNSQSDALFDLSLLPIKQDFYHSQLIFPIEGYGVILLLNENSANAEGNFKQLFSPLVSNLSKAVLLCQNNDIYTTSLRSADEIGIKDLEKIAVGLSVKSGKDFFKSVVLHLAEVLESEYVSISLVNSENQKIIDSIALCVNGQIVDGFSYELTGTPCESVINSNSNTITAFPSDIQQLFPCDKYLVEINMQSYIGIPLLNNRDEVIGSIAVMNKLPMEKKKRIEDILSIFSIRVSNEIGRLQRMDEMQQLSNVVENSPILVFRWRATEGWPVVFASNNVHQLGYVAEDFVSGKLHYSSIIYPEDFLRVDREIQEFVAAGVDEFTQEYRLIAADGKVIWTFDRTTIERNDEGNITYYQGTVIDISARKQIEDELRRSEQHLKLYREQSPLATIEWDLNFQVVTWNTAAEKMFGYTLQEIKAFKSVDIILPEKEREKVKHIWEKLITQKGGITSINENITKDGDIILCEWHNTILIDKAGEVIGAASLVMEITEEHKARQKLLDKEQEQHEILDSMLDAIISINETGCVISFNKMAETLFGYKYEEIVGQNINLLVPEYDSSQQDSYLHHIDNVETSVKGLAREVEGMRKDKTIFPMRWSLAELPLENKGIRRFIGSCQDLSQVKEQEELLRRSQKMDALGKLTGGIAHDYNNMLGVVLGYAELLQVMLVDQPKLAKYANQIQKAGERGAKLTKRLLSFSRHNAPTQASEVDINALLLEQQDMLQKTLTARIKLELHLANNLWPISLDQSEFEDAILNMSINAMHAMADGGSLIIETHNQNLNGIDALMLDLPPGDYIELGITDTGSGMDPVTKSKLFDPFYSTKGNRGTGLGLSQVFGFVKRAEGVIKVHSKLGQGSKFVIYFPRYLVENQEVSEENIKDDIDYTGQEFILIVDDEIFLLDLLTEVLTPLGYNIFRAESGQQALSILENEVIDLMLSDVIMPSMDGYQLSTIVQEKYPNVKIQLATGYNDERQKGSFDKSLYQNILFKPYDKKILLKRIRDIFEKPSSGMRVDKQIKALTTTIDWSDELSIGVAEIDNDHKQILSILNRCISYVNEANEANGDDSEVGQIIEDLMIYAEFHFQREERIMEVCEYPNIKKHQLDHLQLIKEVHQCKKQFEEGIDLSESLLKFLSDWLIKHSIGMDKELTEYCKGKENLIAEALKK